MSDVELEALDRLAATVNMEDDGWFTPESLDRQPIILSSEARFMAAASPTNVRALIRQLRNAEALLAQATR